MILLVCGDRNWTDRATIFNILDALIDQFDADAVALVNGAARGADSNSR